MKEFWNEVEKCADERERAASHYDRCLDLLSSWSHPECDVSIEHDHLILIIRNNGIVVEHLTSF